MRNLAKPSLVAGWSLTKACNLNCRHCSVSAGKKLYNELSLEEIFVILNQLKKLNIKKIELTGGEPLLRKDLFAIIKYAKKKGFIVKLLTNGSLLTKKMLKKLENCNLDKIAVSLDGLSFDVYRKIRPVNKELFDNVINNIKNASKSHIFEKINTVAMKYNFKDIENIVNFCEKNNIKNMRICFFSKMGRGRNLNQIIESEKWINFLTRLKKKIQKKKFKIKIYTGITYFLKDIDESCFLKQKPPEIPLYISSCGDIYLCCMLNSVGNIRKYSFKDILKKINLDKINPCRRGICPLKKFDICNLRL